MAAISCGRCGEPFPAEFWNREEGARCLICGSKVRVIAFPALERSLAGALPEALGEESEASCFYHPQSRAAVPCQQCGRFLCRLCELAVDGRRLCPVCFEKDRLGPGGSARALGNLETRRTMYDTVALALATLPAVLIWPAFVTGPASLWLIFRWWRKPGSIVPRTRIRFYLAALFALAETGGAAFIFRFLIPGLR